MNTCRYSVSLLSVLSLICLNKDLVSQNISKSKYNKFINLTLVKLMNVNQNSILLKESGTFQVVMLLSKTI